MTPNKRWQTPLIYKNLSHINLIYTTMLTVKYPKKTNFPPAQYKNF